MAIPLGNCSWKIFTQQGILQANHPVSHHVKSSAKLPPVSLSKKDVQTLAAQYTMIHLPKKKKTLCIFTLHIYANFLRMPSHLNIHILMFFTDRPRKALSYFM